MNANGAEVLAISGKGEIKVAGGEKVGQTLLGSGKEHLLRNRSVPLQVMRERDIIMRGTGSSSANPRG